MKKTPKINLDLMKSVQEKVVDKLVELPVRDQVRKTMRCGFGPMIIPEA